MSELVGRIRYAAVDGVPVDPDDVIRRAGNVADDRFAEDQAVQAEMIRKLGLMTEAELQASMARCRSEWIEERGRFLAELRHNIVGF
jgi:hypothetical protein